MCGISGILNFKNFNQVYLKKNINILNESHFRRGPDAGGIWVSEDYNIAISHRRLSIIDLSQNSNQPMVSGNAQFIISFNGEIYNFHELRREILDKYDYQFRTSSDTEVILALYQFEGNESFKRLRGMFAIAIWDIAKKKLILTRDGFGIKPLYYYTDKDKLIFSSQVKSIKKCDDLKLTKSAAGHLSFYLNGFIQDPFTLYSEIKSVPSGKILEITYTNNKLNEFIYDHTSISDIWLNALNTKINIKETQERIHSSLLKTVNYHMVSDVPVGLFLSSGIDSISLLGLLNQNKKITEDFSSMNLSFNSLINTKFNESDLASKSANFFDSKLISVKLENEEIDFYLKEIFDSMDQPSIDGINSWLISKIASESKFKVALSGVGADEIFGGYPSFKLIPLLLKFTKIFSNRKFIIKFYENIFERFNLLQNLIPHKAKYIFRYGDNLKNLFYLKRSIRTHQDLNHYFEKSFIDEGLSDLFDKDELSDINFESNLNDTSLISILESSFYLKNQLLRDIDWASMHHSLEVRTPYVDTFFLKEVAPYLINLNKTNKKYLILNSAKINNELKLKLLKRKKTGFSTPLSFDKTITKHPNAWQKKWSETVIKEFI